jgi:Zn-dependent protease
LADNAAVQPLSTRAIRLFQINGIAVSIHWTWFLVAAYEIAGRTGYSSIAWNVVEYLGLFGIITLHEFGHALACRSVGGRADRIMLWPLGGLAFVDSPPRPGATLWSIAAGPLVNFALLPVLGGLALLTSGPVPSDVHSLLRAIAYINVGLLLFNLVPVYPLDGGQILRALLWFLIGRRRSVMVTAVMGLVGSAGLVWLALVSQSTWLVIIAGFVGGQCINSFRVARSLGEPANAPPREGFACPSCKAVPSVGAFWTCSACGVAFDIFEPGAPASTRSETTTLNLSFGLATASHSANAATQCPNCLEDFAAVKCLQCGALAQITSWRAAAVAVPEIPNVLGVVRARPPRPPSIVPVALGACISVLSVLSFLASLLFFSVSSNQLTLQSVYREEINKLWTSTGRAVPGEWTVALQRGGRYDAYVETLTTEASRLGVVDVTITNVDSGQQVAVTRVMERQTSESLRRAGRELSPTASFRIPTSGSYTVHVSTTETLPGDTLVKLGPSVGLVRADASLARGIAIATFVLSLLLVTVALWLFARYRTQRKAFNSALERFHQGHSLL